MEIDFLNISLAFLEGLALIISPCILPILPIILSGSLGSGKRRPIGIILGFIITFAVFTFFSRKLVLYSGIDLNIVRNISFVLLALFGLIMMSDYLTDRMIKWTGQLENLQTSIPLQEKEGFLSGLIFGALIGLIWTPCAGPILAAVIVQTVLQKTTFSSFLTILAFGIGVAIPMFIITFFGQRIMQRMSFFKTHAGAIRKILGAIIIMSVLLMLWGPTINPALNPSYNITSEATKEKINQMVPIKPTKLIDGLMTPYNAPPIAGIQAWINSPPLQIDELKGKVVLIDFWAYSCINCIRTLPYLIDWYNKYKDQGFVIIGVHSPEFDFERDYNNVQKAVNEYGIKYSVALDNNFTTWQNYQNNYWPAHYLIDKNGNVVYEHFGEGDYDITENNIRYLLGISAEMPAKEKPEENYFSEQTPETYLGYERANEYYGKERILIDETHTYSYPENVKTTANVSSALPQNAWVLQGDWDVGAQKITATKPNASILLHFFAGKVYAVMGSENNQPIRVKVTLDGKPVTNGAGKDVKDGLLTVMKHDLYSLLDLKDNSSGVIELIVLDPGLEIYTFTFGGS